MCDFGTAKAVAGSTSFFEGRAFAVKGRKCEGKEEDIRYDRRYIKKKDNFI